MARNYCFLNCTDSLGVWKEIDFLPEQPATENFSEILIAKKEIVEDQEVVHVSAISYNDLFLSLHTIGSIVILDSSISSHKQLYGGTWYNIKEITEGEQNYILWKRDA
jgi:hypothetical protein